MSNESQISIKSGLTEDCLLEVQYRWELICCEPPSDRFEIPLKPTLISFQPGAAVQEDHQIGVTYKEMHRALILLINDLRGSTDGCGLNRKRMTFKR